MIDEKGLSDLKNNLEAKKSLLLSSIKEKHSDALDWLEKKGLDLGEVKDSQIKRLAAAAATGILLLSPGSVAAKALPNPVTGLLAGPGKDVANLTTINDPGAAFAGLIKEKLTTAGDKIKEQELEKLIKDSVGVDAKYEIDGFRLNTNVGLIGAEQHLYRWPGDTPIAHNIFPEDAAMYGSSGIAPNRGAYGYFGSVGDQAAVQRERYYFAIQTFLSPNWAKDQRATYEFFKFRKLIAVNTRTGQAAVGVVGDAGPAQFTGKSYGGSPEMMESLGLAKGPRKGEILLLLVNDPENKIPLGSVSLNTAY